MADCGNYYGHSVVSKFDLFDGNLIGLYKIKLLSWSVEEPRSLTLMSWTKWKLLSLIHKNHKVTVCTNVNSGHFTNLSCVVHGFHLPFPTH